MAESLEERPAYKQKTLTELYEELCPMYMSMGMSYEQYWDGDPGMVKPFREMYERQQRQMNFNAWLIGRYVHDAFSVVYSNAWSKHSDAKYPERPYPLTEKEDRERKQEEARLRMERIFSYVAKQVRVQQEGANNATD